jgi:tetratricopeptide (TPR) repeat protein
MRSSKPTCKGRRVDNGTRCRATILQEHGYCRAHQDQVHNPWKRFCLCFKAFRNRVWPVAVLLALGGVFTWLNQNYSAYTGRPFGDLLRNLIPPTPFTTPAAEGEYLIIVTEFKDDSAGRNLEVRTILADSISTTLPVNLHARVFAAPPGLTPSTEPEARAIGQDYNATVILWGLYNDSKIEVYFTPLVELAVPTRKHDKLIVRQSLDELMVFVNNEAAGPMRWLSLLTIGQLLYHSDRYDEAIACFDQALALLRELKADQGQLAATYFYRGSAYFSQGHLDSAIADLSRAIELDPRNANAHNNLGLAYAENGQIESAIAHYNQAVKIRSDYAEAYYNRGIAYMAKPDYVRAIADFSEAIHWEPKNPRGYNSRGTAYLTCRVS